MRGDPTHIGTYRILGRLGEGGMGVVYRGRDESTGAEVAVKVVSDASGAGTAGIRREIHALARVSHPGVAHVLDQGISSGKPWYAMELVRGRTLRAILSEHWRRRPEVAPTGPAAAGLSQNAAGPGPIAAAALQICADLCEPLAVVHAAGLVHRDLKPDNILVTAEGRPVLLDFGIAASFGGASGREVLLSAGEVIGTLEYMSPEQIRGDLVDARADLYALGCTLYECLTGHTPFGGRPAARILQAHLHEAPEPPSRRGAAVSPELDALVLRLLAKRPADRPGYATDIPAMLWAAGAAGPPQHGSPARVAPYLYRAELAGRDSVMARARAALVALGREGKGGAVFVIGESGVGKTRVGMEMVRAAAGLGLKVITGQCLPPGRHGATPLHPFVPAFREAPEEALYDARVRVLAPYFPEAAALVPSGSAAEPASLSPEAARARALDAAEALLLDVAAGQPLLLVLDDAQWADELSLALLGRLEPAKIAARGLLCVCLFRAEEATDTLTALSHAPGAERWSLDRLDKTSIAAIAAGMLASAHFPDAWGEVIARVSGGNPFFAEEYLRSAVEAGLLTRDRRGAWCIQASDAARARRSRCRRPSTRSWKSASPGSTPPSCTCSPQRRCSGALWTPRSRRRCAAWRRAPRWTR
ncbi:MAG: protein kinase [Polyangiaceae bacterium]